MSYTRIKICGITNEADARAAVDCGADAIGLVFYAPSSRSVTAAQAAAIARAVPPFVTVVALFVDEPVAQVLRILEQVPVDLLQFHGDESPEYCASFGRPYIKALRVREELDLVAQARRFPDARGLLLDSWQDGLPGGTGKTFDWSLAELALPLPVVLAGGLNKNNVGDALAQLNPAGVDVSGGVEREPGKKDHQQVADFIAAVRAAHTEV